MKLKGTTHTTQELDLMVRENSHLTDEQIEKLKKQLLKTKEEINNKELDHNDYCLDKTELSDPLDEASANTQASHELRFRNREVFFLKKINKTLQRMEDEVYGLCDDCGNEISFERLNARPTAELCITCKEESEMTEKNNFFQKRSKSLGKTLQEMR